MRLVTLRATDQPPPSDCVPYVQCVTIHNMTATKIFSDWRHKCLTNHAPCFTKKFSIKGLDLGMGGNLLSHTTASTKVITRINRKKEKNE